MWLDYGFVLMGFVLFLIPLFGKRFYYGDELADSNRPAPTLSSKVFFFLGSLLFISLGLLDLFGVIALNRTD